MDGIRAAIGVAAVPGQVYKPKQFYYTPALFQLERGIFMPYLRKRGKKWYYTIEISTAGGKRKRKEVVGGNTKAEAAAAYARAVVELQGTGAYFEPTKMTVSDYFKEWFDVYCPHNFRKNTIATYQRMARLHILPIIGDMRLPAVKPTDLQALVNELQQQGLSHSTISITLTVIKRAFAYAADFAEYLQKDPAQNVRVPRDAAAAVPSHAFTRDQVHQILEKYPPGHAFHLPVLIAYHTGARIGEICALTWKDVDFDAREIHINKTVINVNGPEIQPAPKTSGSRRVIPYGRALQDILKRQRKGQLINAMQYGAPPPIFVCQAARGGALNPKLFAPFNHWTRTTFGPGYTFHSLRHTHATMLLEAGEDLEVVSKRLGHTSINTTAKTYSHILEQRKAKTVKLLDDIL